MKALVCNGRGQKAWQDVPKATIQDNTDAVVRVDCTTICGRISHILKGDVPRYPRDAFGTRSRRNCRDRRFSGEHGGAWRSGPRVMHQHVCGRCRFCRDGRYGQCLGGGGWILGHLIDGTQAEYVRVPFADTSLYKVPAGASDEEILMLADILPTSYEVGVLNGHVQPGDTVAVVGAGPIGLSAILAARLYSPSHVIAMDLADTRLEAAKLFGADLTVNNGREDPVAFVKELTDGLGVDVAIEAVGVPESFELCAELVRPGGHVANIGVHGAPATLHLETLWIRDVTVTTGLVDTYSTPTLLRLVASHQIEAGRFASHHFDLDDMMKAYDVFARAADTGAVKVVLSR